MVLVTRGDPADPPGGRALLSQLNEDLLRDLFGDRLSVVRLTGRTRPSSVAVLRGQIDGVDAGSIAAIRGTLDACAASDLFLDGSNLGAAARAARRSHPRLRITTFLHNVEARFFLGALRHRPSPHAAGVLAANWVAERAAVRASDALLCLSERDSVVLRRWHGRGATAILPIALADQPPSTGLPRTGERFALFVGGGFYANLAGARWFVERVLPRLPIDLVVVGRGMEALSGPQAGLRVVGAVEDLSAWYRDAALVVAPIFDGSGMKTKVAEALMHGKQVVGTPEAFSGYSDAVVRANRCAADADEVVAAIMQALAADAPAFSSAHRLLYEREHSPAAARARLAAALGVAAPQPRTSADAADAIASG